MLAVLKLLDTIKLLRQLIHLTAEFFLGDLGIDLSAFDVLVAQYGGNNLDRHSVRQANYGGHRVAALVPCQMLLNPAYLGNCPDDATAGIELRDVKDMPIGAKTVILLNNACGNIQQLYICIHSGFLATIMNPSATVNGINNKILLLQVHQVNIRYSCEAAEDEKVTDERALCIQFGTVYHSLHLFFRHKTLLCLFLMYLITEVSHPLRWC